MSAKSAGRRDLLDRVIRKYRPTQPDASLAYSQLIECVRANSTLLSPRSFRTRSAEEELHFTESFVRAISRMARFSDRMIRPPYTWNPEKHSIHSLSMHLFTQFDVPEFAHRAWFGDIEEIRVLLDIARGVNPRKAISRSGLTSRLTKKAAHFFANAPDRFGIRETIRWAQAKAIGASPDLAIRIVKACRQYQYDEDFWSELVQFLVYACSVKPGKRELSIVAPDDAELNEIAEFVWKQKYVNASRILGYQVLNDVPLQPEFSFKGRTLKSLRRHMRNWQSEIEIPIRTPINISQRNFAWPTSGIQPLKLEEDGITWQFTEITDSLNLRIEGGLMQHCVAVYEASCRTGRCSIWSLRRKVKTSIHPIVTIEVWPNSNRIVQIRAKRNTFATPHSKALIRKWAQLNGLAMN